MKDSRVSAEIVEPYAQALMSLAQEHELVDAIGNDTNGILSLLNESSDLQSFLTNPIVKSEDKKSVLGQILSDQVHPYVLSFLNLLVDRGRVLFLQDVCLRYQDLLRALRQTVLAEVKSATPLTEAQQQAVQEKVKALTEAQQVELDMQVDPEILGGVIIKVGSQVIDASLRGQLRRISLQLSGSSN